MLCDAMGLGKTVMILSLIFSSLKLKYTKIAKKKKLLIDSGEDS